MNLNEYQSLAMKTAIYPNVGHGLVYPALKLAGESGEVAEAVGKMLRDDNGLLTDKKREQIIKELGDVMWYVAACATEISCSLNTIATENIKKLESRQERGVLQGSGDYR